jgi:hypothetical protein
MTRRRTPRLLIIGAVLLLFTLQIPMPRAVSAETTSTAYGDANKDAYVESGYPSTPTGNQQNHYLGHDTWYSKGQTRIYIQFNLPSLPEDAQVDSAQLEIYQYAHQCSGSYGVTAYEVTSDWGEYTLTWNNQPSKGRTVGTASFGCSEGWRSVDITDLVKDWYDGHANHGVTLWANDEYSAGGVFRSRDCTAAQCPGQEHPRLKVDYSLPPPPTDTPTPSPTPTETPTPSPTPTSVYDTAWLTDEDLEDDYDTSVETIRAFLERQGSCLADPMLDVDGVTIDVPQLIHDAALAYHINPKVILATMQKEQSAITHCPETWRLKRLMGAGGASTARHQIDFGTSLFRAYQDELNDEGVTRSGWKVGVDKQTQDGVSVTPATRAVAGQFTYTPYAGANWGGDDADVGGVWLFWNAWYNLFHFDQPWPEPDQPDQPSSSCEVPYFSQRDARWINHPLRSGGACSAYCSTIGHCGCTLTSATMLFNHFGSSLTPASLSDCMWTQACPFYWATGASCSEDNAQWVTKYPFSWDRLERELNDSDRPVILGMSGQTTHWVLVLDGSGDDPANYTIHDPWPINGARMKLDAYRDWSFDTIAVYDGEPVCEVGAALSVDQGAPRPEIGLTATSGASHAQQLAASSVFTGSVWLYRMTDVTMTVQLIADSQEGKVDEMRVWTDATAEPTAWQPFATFVELLASDEIHARFRDEAGNVSDVVSDVRYPVGGPGQPQPVGGVTRPPSSARLLAPWAALAALVGLLAACAAAVRRRRA